MLIRVLCRDGSGDDGHAATSVADSMLVGAVAIPDRRGMVLLYVRVPSGGIHNKGWYWIIPSSISCIVSFSSGLLGSKKRLSTLTTWSVVRPYKTSRLLIPNFVVVTPATLTPLGKMND